MLSKVEVLSYIENIDAYRLTEHNHVKSVEYIEI